MGTAKETWQRRSAREKAEWALDLVQRSRFPSELSEGELIAFAQAQATLALVEQQRIANLIAVGMIPRGEPWGPYLMDTILDYPPTPEGSALLKPSVRKSLGLS